MHWADLFGPGKWAHGAEVGSMGRSRMSLVKRQRELKKAEKAAQKRAKRYGAAEETFTEPQPTVRLTDPATLSDSPDDSDDSDESDETEP